MAASLQYSIQLQGFNLNRLYRRLVIILLRAFTSFIAQDQTLTEDGVG